MRKEKRLKRNDRGVALLIVLLVTALLIALIFEFAYGTRVSLRGAVNFRDSQRAYFLARSGVNFVGLLMSENLKAGAPQNNLEHLEWREAPLIGVADAELRMRWEDEAGKININTVFKGNSTYKLLSKLFELRGVSQEVLDRMCPSANDRVNFLLLTDLHKYLSEEEYSKVFKFVTVSPVGRIDINTAAPEVLQSIGLSSGMTDMIVERRKREPFKSGEVNAFLGPQNVVASGMLDVTSSVFKVNSFATVGGYTKQIEAVINRSTSGFSVSYWRAL
jgi:type II secretory pathway component PulK